MSNMKKFGIILLILCVIGAIIGIKAANAAPSSTYWDVIVRYPDGGVLQWYGCKMYSEEQSYIVGWSEGYIEASCEGAGVLDDPIDWQLAQALPSLRLHLNDGYHYGCRLIYRRYASYDDTGSMLVDCQPMARRKEARR